jgi:hypothetical protein
MTSSIASRRHILRLAVTGAVATAAGNALAYQGNMERALASLYDALASLREATPNKGGHKATAVQLIEKAIEEVRAGIDYADEHGGGGNGR